MCDERTPLMSTNASASKISTDRIAFVQSSTSSAGGRRSPFHFPDFHASRVMGESSDATHTPPSAYWRFVYYNKLKERQRRHLDYDDDDYDHFSAIPDHIVPPSFFVPFFNMKPEKSQSSIVTIFAIWNTMMGTSLLSMPWAFAQAGFAASILFLLIMGVLCLYTSYRIMRSTDYIDTQDHVEFPDIARRFLGRFGFWVSFGCSMLPLIGATIVFWVLMSNFSSEILVFLYDWFSGNGGSADSGEIVCLKPTPGNGSNEVIYGVTNTTNNDAWFITAVQSPATMPLILAVLLLPLVNLKSPTFFYKFTSLGTVSVFYLIIYIIVKSAQWGINLNFHDVHSDDYTPLFRPTFPALTGVLCLSFFLHNCVISMMRYQRNPVNNGRDLSIAYLLVGMTYLMIGLPFYMTFPKMKSCIEDNFLKNFHTHDVMASVTRMFLFVQYATLFPMIAYLLRSQCMHTLYGNVYPSRRHVWILNTCVIALCVIFAIFIPQVGNILRYCGAISGLAYVFALPCLVYMLAEHYVGRLTAVKIVGHVTIILVGIVNFIMQFILPYL